MTRFRGGYALAAAVLFAVEAAIALRVHDTLVRPLVGDALVVALVHCAVRAVTPLRTTPAICAAFALACAVEVGQAFALVDRLGLGGNAVARVVLGTRFDPLDFVAYALGAVATLAAERLRRGRSKPTRRRSSPRA